MNSRQTAFMIWESDELFARIAREHPGELPPPPTDQETKELLERAERYDWPWKRLWHRIKPPEWRR